MLNEPVEGRKGGRKGKGEEKEMSQTSWVPTASWGPKALLSSSLGVWRKTWGQGTPPVEERLQLGPSSHCLSLAVSQAHSLLGPGRRGTFRPLHTTRTPQRELGPFEPPGGASQGKTPTGSQNPRTQPGGEGQGVDSQVR